MGKQLKDMANAIRDVMSGVRTKSTMSSAQDAADFLRSMAELDNEAPLSWERSEFNEVRDMFQTHRYVSKDYADWHITQHAKTKRKLGEATKENEQLKQRIAVAVKMIEVNNSYEHTAWNSQEGLRQILLMSGSEIKVFLQQHPEYAP